MSARRSITLAAAALALVPASASAATAPTITGPEGAVPGGRPQLGWTLGPAGEYVSQLVFARAGSVDDSGALTTTRNVRRLGNLGSSTSATVEPPLHAGRWYWNAAWSTATDATPAQTGWTGVASFTVPTVLRTMRGTYVQHTGNSRFEARGSFYGNPLVVRVTCSIHMGRRTIIRRRVAVRPNTSGRTSFRCPRMWVPERHDGRPMGLRVLAVGGGRRLLAVQRFRAT